MKSMTTNREALTWAEAAVEEMEKTSIHRQKLIRCIFFIAGSFFMYSAFLEVEPI
jgi:hypothetical protein